MRLYVQVSGVIFALVVAGHIGRIAVEPASLRDPIFVVSSLIAVFLTGWAWRVLRQAPAAK